MADSQFRQGLRFPIDNTHFRVMQAIPRGVSRDVRFDIHIPEGISLERVLTIFV